MNVAIYYRKKSPHRPFDEDPPSRTQTAEGGGAGVGWEGCPTGVVAAGVEHQDVMVPPPGGESVLPSFYRIHICFTRIFPALFSLLPQKPRTQRL